MTIVFPIGISGSGKSHLYDTAMPKDMVLVCPDDIRREVNGSVSDQSNPAKIFRIAYNRVIEALNNSKDVYFSATNLNSRNLMDMINELKEKLNDFNALNIKFFILTDSFKTDLCIGRVNNDLKTGVDRSIVPEDVILKQAQRFNSMIDNLEHGVFNKFLKENSIPFEIVYN